MDDVCCSKEPWSHLSYWECNRHIGHKWLPVLTPVLVVLNEELGCLQATPPSENRPIWSKQGRLCLDRLVRRSETLQHPPSYSIQEIFRSSPTKQRRRLSHEGISLLLLPAGQILLTNHTPTTPIFVASPCFVEPGEVLASDWPVCRVAPTHSLIVFDTCVYEDRLKETRGNRTWPGKSIFGPVLLVSLGKGWGPAYQRSDFTHCPSRLEIWLNLATIKSHVSAT